MKIACVYKTGGDFDSEYVESLYSGLSQYGDFLCFTDGDVPDYIQTQPLVHGWEGWWSKIEALGYDDDILLFDLDTVIVGDISEMVEKARGNQMIMLSDFYRPEKPASGIMYVPNDIGTFLYDLFKTQDSWYMTRFRGDQDFISCFWKEIDRWDRVLAKDYICSYKAHVIKTAPRHLKPLQADYTKSKIVCFHGKPRPRDVKEIWNAC